MTYETIKQAILAKKSMTAVYHGMVRHFSPHAIGGGKNGTKKVSAYQYAGVSSKILPPEGAWRCFDVHDLRDVSVNGDRFHTGLIGHKRRPTCVTSPDATVQL